MSGFERSPRAGGVLVLAVLLVAGWFAYQPAFTAGFAVDDVGNLAGLARVDDRRSALEFVFGGESGPLGRPLALASFLPQADAWADGAGSFLRVNVLIHLLNAALLAAFLGLLLRAAGLQGPGTRYAVLAATALWLFLPIHAWASLAVVQRMTTLSATFVLLGLVAYLAARSGSAERPQRALLLMTLAVGVGTLLAVFTKESGALLPAYLLVLECTLLATPAGIAPRRFRAFRAVLLGLPTLAIAGYLLMRLPYSADTVLWRDFTAWERLLTEARILWLYLVQAFLPLPVSLPPVNDMHGIARSLFEPLTFVAVTAWLALVAAACAWRRRYPLAAFAVLWYLAGHLIESTVFPLEVYFSHRNYLPLVGPVFAGCVAVLRVPPRFVPAALAALAVYAVLLAGSLHALTSLSGQPGAAARYWYLKYPDSVRAATRAITWQLDHEGVDAALGSLGEFVERRPEHGYLLIQDLNIRCRLDSDGDYAAEIDRLLRLLGQVAPTYTAATMLSQLVDTAARTGCRAADPATLRALADALRDNPRYRERRHFLGLYHQIVALTFRLEGDFDAALEHLREAGRHGAANDTTLLRVLTLAQAGRRDAAASLVADARDAGPRHPVKQYLWQRDLDDMERYLAALAGDEIPGDGDSTQ